MYPALKNISLFIEWPFYIEEQMIDSNKYDSQVDQIKSVSDEKHSELVCAKVFDILLK